MVCAASACRAGDTVNAAASANTRAPTDRRYLFMLTLPCVHGDIPDHRAPHTEQFTMLTSALARASRFHSCMSIHRWTPLGVGDPHRPRQEEEDDASGGSPCPPGAAVPGDSQGVPGLCQALPKVPPSPHPAGTVRPCPRP